MTNRNVTVVERDPDVFEKMSKSPALDGCREINADLLDYKENSVFDLIYLDFKSNLCWDVMDIIKQLLLRNTRDGTVFYINSKSIKFL